MAVGDLFEDFESEVGLVLILTMFLGYVLGSSESEGAGEENEQSRSGGGD
jgi:hypothetical protein